MTEKTSPCHIAIIGAGFSGTLMAVQLLSRSGRHTRVTLIERHPPFGLGVAYRSQRSSHVLNVPAARMSAFEDRPDDFVNWLNVSSDVYAGMPRPALLGEFVPRYQYGLYLQDLLWKHAGQASCDLDVRHACVLDIRRKGKGYALQLDRFDAELHCDAVVLATGHFPPDSDRPPHYFGNPWNPQALSDLREEAPVVLVGSGLTMVDVASTLLDQGHRGPVTAISRHGLLPQPHGPDAPPVLPGPVPEFGGSMRDLVRAVRNHCRTGDCDWRTLIDTLRPQVPEVWQGLDTRERLRFLRHVRPWWDIHRHRIAPQVHARISEAIAAGQLRIRAARVTGMRDARRGTTVVLRARGSARPEALLAARVINCSGPRGYADASDPLLASMLHRGLCRSDPLGLGLDVQTDGSLRNRDGERQPGMYAVGPATRGTFWEITAVPDIRRQCEAVACTVIAAPARAVPEAV